MNQFSVPSDELYELFERGQLDECIASCRLALSRDGAQVEVLNCLGRALHARGCFPESVTVYRDALQRGDGLAGVHNNLGLVLEEMSELDEAEAEYRSAIEIFPDFAKAYYNLGNCLAKKDLWEDAVAMYRRCLQLSPLFRDARANLQVATRHLAITRCKAHVDACPDDADAHFQLGKAFEDGNCYDDAAREYTAAITLATRWAAPLLERSEIYAKMGRLDDSTRDLCTAMELEPFSCAAHISAARGLERFGELGRAKQEYLDAIQLDATNAHARIGLGGLLQRAGDYDGAAEQYQIANANRPVDVRGCAEVVARLMRQILAEADSERKLWLVGSLTDRGKKAQGAGELTRRGS